MRGRIGRCEGCGGQLPLELHHLTYETVDEEMPDDLVALCRDCHHQQHRDINGEFWADPADKEDYWAGYWHALEKGD